MRNFFNTSKKNNKNTSQDLMNALNDLELKGNDVI